MYCCRDALLPRKPLQFQCQMRNVSLGLAIFTLLRAAAALSLAKDCVENGARCSGLRLDEGVSGQSGCHYVFEEGFYFGNAVVLRGQGDLQLGKVLPELLDAFTERGERVS
ncbi:hypothetical protein MTO96_037506 [Rhipicephalus appendiculatus]